jgi:hypothetical protein
MTEIVQGVCYLCDTNICQLSKYVLCCTICQLLFRTQCVGVPKSIFRPNNFTKWTCLCFANIFPFNHISNSEEYMNAITSNDKSNIIQISIKNLIFNPFRTWILIINTLMVLSKICPTPITMMITVSMTC